MSLFLTSVCQSSKHVSHRISKQIACFVNHSNGGILSCPKLHLLPNKSRGNKNHNNKNHNNNSQSHNPFRRTSMLFGTKRGVDGNPPGSITIYDEQTTLTQLDIPKITQTISDIRQMIGYETYDVALVLCEDEEMQEMNKDTRGVDAPTDILSFPFSDEIMEPGILADPEFDIPDYYNLGDMIIDIPYVIRRCEEDFTENSKNNGSNNDDNDDVERGVSGAMSTVYDPEERIHMLLVHGMLHLVGYDHIEDDDYELMVAKEEELLKQIQQLKNGKDD